jgi:hypothetical protein
MRQCVTFLVSLLDLPDLFVVGCVCYNLYFVSEQTAGNVILQRPLSRAVDFFFFRIPELLPNALAILVTMMKVPPE